MNPVETKITSLIESSKQILLDCCLGNGAVIAANTDKSYYPREANNYRYVWPRDAAFILYALQILDEDRSHEFTHWLLNRAENFNTNGLAYRRYATNGAACYPENQLQPDQAGSMLWLLCQGSITDQETAKSARILANTLTSWWHKDCFNQTVYDLWEHHYGDGEDGNFTYTLASASFGLKMAYKNLSHSEKEWKYASDAMADKMSSATSPSYAATVSGNLTYLDSSLFGLTWPFNLNFDPIKLENLINELTSTLKTEAGFIRFKRDVYDGRVANSKDLNEVAGAWPLLSFWYVIALTDLGHTAEAKEYFEKFVLQLPSGIYIPEQVLPRGKVGVNPLGWSHAMFIIACDKLGYLS